MTEFTIYQRTIKVKLDLNDEQKNALNSSMSDAIKVFNLFSKLCCKHKSVSYMTLHKYGYLTAKELCPSMPTAYIQSIAKSACSCVKSWNTNNKKKQWQYKGKKKTTTIPLNKLTFSRRGNLTTISTNNKRIKILHDIPEWFVDKYKVTNNDIQAGSISYRKGVFELCIVYNIKVDNIIKENNYIGIDRGLYNFVTLSNGSKIASKEAITIKRRYQYNRSKLQQKGTRSAKRKLKSLSGREKRFMLDFNHIVSKQLANKIDVSCYILEDLNGIRNKRKSKKLNSWLSSWSYFQFQTLLEYKCAMQSTKVVYVDPRYTSQKCNNCGVVDRSNRNKSRYICKCGYSNHADINAALNIRDNYALSSNRDRLFSSNQ